MHLTKPSRLIAMDYDGVISSQKHGSISLEIMKSAIKQTFGWEHKGVPCSQGFWNTLFSQTKGTSEMALFLQLCAIQNINYSHKTYLRYVQRRAELIEQWNKENNVHYFDERNIYPDVVPSLIEIKADPKYRTILAIVTGNPEEILSKRVPREVASLIDFVVGGSEGRNRKELLEVAKNKAVRKYGLKITSDSGLPVNLLYVDDVSWGATSHPLDFRSVTLVREDNPSWRMKQVMHPGDIGEEMDRFIQETTVEESGEIYISGGSLNFAQGSVFVTLADLGLDPMNSYRLVSNEVGEKSRNRFYITDSFKDPELRGFLDYPIWNSRFEKEASIESRTQMRK